MEALDLMNCKHDIEWVEDKTIDKPGWRKNYIIFPELRNTTLAKDDKKFPKLTSYMTDYINNFETMLEKKIGMLLVGGVGTGKSFYASCIANALNDEARKPNYIVMMTNIPYLLSKKQEDSWEWNYAEKCPVLIIDDFGVERDTSYMNENVYELINSRYTLDKAVTIITTNLTTQQLSSPSNPYDQARIYSRIIEMCPKVVRVPGEDRRPNIAKIKVEEFE